MAHTTYHRDNKENYGEGEGAKSSSDHAPITKDSAYKTDYQTA